MLQLFIDSPVDKNVLIRFESTVAAHNILNGKKNINT